MKLPRCRPDHRGYSSKRSNSSSAGRLLPARSTHHTRSNCRNSPAPRKARRSGLRPVRDRLVGDPFQARQGCDRESLGTVRRLSGLWHLPHVARRRGSGHGGPFPEKRRPRVRHLTGDAAPLRPARTCCASNAKASWRLRKVTFSVLTGSTCQRAPTNAPQPLI
jgi:hypothetical protein